MTQTPPTSDQATDTLRVLPSRTEPIARTWTRFLGGPIDRHGLIGRSRWFTPWYMILGSTIGMLAIGYISKANCIRPNSAGTDVTWSGNRQYVSACYSDIIPLYGIEGISQGHFPYLYSWVENGHTRYMEYPVLSGLFQWFSGLVASPFNALFRTYNLGIPPVSVYFTVCALLLSAAWVTAVWYTFRLAQHRPWDTLLVALSPLVGVQIFTNFDALAILATMAALYSFTTGRYRRAGIWAGLGAAAKLYPALTLFVFLILGARRLRGKKAPDGAVGGCLTALLWAMGTWAAVNLPILTLSPAGWAHFFTFNAGRSFEYGTIPKLLEDYFGLPVTSLAPSTQSLISIALMALALAAIAIMGYRVTREPTVVELMFLATLAFLATNKVWSTQYSLWLIPLIGLAYPRPRLVLAWGFNEALVWLCAMWWMLGPNNKGIPGWLFNDVVVVRDILLVVITVGVIRMMRGRRPDIPRTQPEAVQRLYQLVPAPIQKEQ